MSILINGSAGDTIPVTDRGLQYGDGVFETVAVSQGVPLLLEDHIRRLLDGCRKLGFVSPPEAPTLRDEARRVIGDVGRGVLKIIVTRGGGGRGYRPDPRPLPTRILSLHQWPGYYSVHRSSGVRVRLCRTRLAHQPALAGFKHLNRLEQVLARAEWVEQYEEGLMLDQDGDVVSGTMSNVFGVRDGALGTPDVSRCGIAGIMRAQTLAQAAQLGIRRGRWAWPVDALSALEEAFLTNSLIGIWPIRQLVDRRLPIGPVTRMLQDKLGESRLAVTD